MKKVIYRIIDKEPPLILTNENGYTISSYRPDSTMKQTRLEFFRFLLNLRRWSGMKAKRVKE